MGSTPTLQNKSHCNKNNDPIPQALRPHSTFPCIYAWHIQGQVYPDLTNIMKEALTNLFINFPCQVTSVLQNPMTNLLHKKRLQRTLLSGNDDDKKLTPICKFKDREFALNPEQKGLLRNRELLVGTCKKHFSKLRFNSMWVLFSHFSQKDTQG